MAINTGDTRIDQTPDVSNESLGLFSRAVEAARTHSRTALLALGIGTYAVAANAEEVRVADANGVVQLAALQDDGSAGLVEGGEIVLQDSEWLNDLDLTNPVVREFIAPRITDSNFEYMRPYLVAFSQLSPEMQDYIARADQGIGGLTDEDGNVVDPLNEEHFELLRNLRVPPELRQAILDEATANEVSSRNFRGIEGFLTQLADEGDLTENRFAIIERYAPDGYTSIPRVVALIAAEVSAEAAEVSAEAAEVSAEAAEVSAEAAEVSAEAAIEEARINRIIAEQIAAAAAQAEESFTN